MSGQPADGLCFQLFRTTIPKRTVVTYDYVLDKGAVMLTQKTCELLMEMPDSCILSGGPPSDSFIIYDYRP